MGVLLLSVFFKVKLSFKVNYLLCPKYIYEIKSIRDSSPSRPQAPLSVTHLKLSQTSGAQCPLVCPLSHVHVIQLHPRYNKLSWLLPPTENVKAALTKQSLHKFIKNTPKSKQNIGMKLRYQLARSRIICD